MWNIKWIFLLLTNTQTMLMTCVQAFTYCPGWVWHPHLLQKQHDVLWSTSDLKSWTGSTSYFERLHHCTETSSCLIKIPTSANESSPNQTGDHRNVDVNKKHQVQGRTARTHWWESILCSTAARDRGNKYFMSLHWFQFWTINVVESGHSLKFWVIIIIILYYYTTLFIYLFFLFFFVVA